MNKKAIRVDLSTFFDDERRVCCILVDPSWESVACLQKRVELLFDISPVRFLSDGCYLPPQEPIEILKFFDNVKAFVPNEFQETKKKKKSKKSKEILEESRNAEVICNDPGVQQEDDLHKKRKLQCLQSVTSPNISGNNAKRLKNSNKNENIQIPLLLNETMRLTNGNNNENIKIPMSPKMKSETVNDEMTTATQFGSFASSTVSNASTFLEENNNIQDLSKPKNRNNPFKKPKHSKAHIYFNESGEIASPKSKQKSTPKPENETGKVVIFRCPLSDVSNGAQPLKPRIFHLKSKSVENSTPKKQIVEIQEEIILSSQLIRNGTNGSLTSEAIVVNSAETEENKRDSFDKNQTSNSQAITKADEKQSVSATSLNGSQKEETITTEAQNESLERLSSVINIQSENQTVLTTGGEIVSLTENESQMEVTQVDKNNTEPCDEPEMEKRLVDEKDSVVKNEISTDQANADETSIMSVDCVDLSIDLEEENKSRDYDQEKHDLTADDESNVSSASDVEEISEIIDLNESEDNLCSTLNNSRRQSISAKEIKVHKILPFSHDLTDLPNNEDIVVFRVAYVNINKIRSYTNFVAGRVEYINKRTKGIKILVLDGGSELSQVPNNLFCHFDDSQECVQHLQLKFSDMFEPKLYSKP